MRLFPIECEQSSDDWYTPPWIFDGMNITFNLDVASPPGGVEWVPTHRYYTAAEDGLLQPWDGVVWCNPPYSAPTAWCVRWASHANGVILLRADLSTRGPHIAYKAASSMHFPERRLQFVNGRGGATGAVTFSSVLLGVGAEADAGLLRLAMKYGGTTRLLKRGEQQT